MINVGVAFTSNFFLTFKSLFDQSVDQFLIFKASVKIGRVQSAEFSDPGKLAEGVLAATPIGLLLEQDVNESKIAFGRCTRAMTVARSPNWSKGSRGKSVSVCPYRYNFF